MFGGHQKLHITTNTPSPPTWWWHHHAEGMLLSSRPWKIVTGGVKINTAKYREILEKNWFTVQENYDLGEHLFSSKTATRSIQQKRHRNGLNINLWMFCSGLVCLSKNTFWKKWKLKLHLYQKIEASAIWNLYLTRVGIKGSLTIRYTIHGPQYDNQHIARQSYKQYIMISI